MTRKQTTATHQLAELKTCLNQLYLPDEQSILQKLCDICPLSQLELCAGAHRVPAARQIHDVARVLPEASELEVVNITERAAVVSSLATEQPR